MEMETFITVTKFHKNNNNNTIKSHTRRFKATEGNFKAIHRTSISLLIVTSVLFPASGNFGTGRLFLYPKFRLEFGKWVQNFGVWK